MTETKMQEKTKHAINWFEIPVTNIDRAVNFYSTILGVKLERSDMGPVKMGIFPGSGDEKGCVVHGALVQGEGFVPSDKGVVLYLNANPDLSIALAKVEKAGGKVLKPKFSIGEHGFIAYFKDTEGNKIALHSMK